MCSVGAGGERTEGGKVCAHLHDRDLDVCDFDDGPQVFDLIKIYMWGHVEICMYAATAFGSPSNAAKFYGPCSVRHRDAADCTSLYIASTFCPLGV